jgi:uncharacterized protein
MASSHSFVYLAYGLLYLSVIALWLPTIAKIPVWVPLLLASFVFALLSHQIEFIALGPIIVFYFSIHFGYRKKSPTIRMAANIITLMVGIGLSANFFPGFNSFSVINEAYLSKDSVPYHLFLNFGKPLVGIFMLGMSSHLLIAHKKDWHLLFKRLFPSSLIIIFILVILALSLGFVRIDVKLPSSLWIWALTNLLFIATAEEAFFRAFIQKRLMMILKENSYGGWLAIGIASLLFGVAHFPGGIKYMILMAVAGLGFGWLYVKTKRIEASILTHFGLNIVHFLLFTYPMAYLHRD